jgi:ABC-type amino acid transport substrate-binding protein
MGVSKSLTRSLTIPPADQAGSSRSGPRVPPRLLQDLLILSLVLLPFILANGLPQDTSFSEARRTGLLTACVPSSFFPLAMPHAADKGFDIRLLDEIARRLDLTLNLNVIPNIGRDFDPRGWGINRASCQIIAGGISVTARTRAFLETAATGIDTGWAILARSQASLAKGTPVGVYPGYGGLDRVALSQFLREHELRLQLMPTAAALERALTDGAFDTGVTESLSARAIAKAHPELTIAWLPIPDNRASLGFGLWKGDLTLKRKVLAVLDQMRREGFVTRLETEYGLGPIEPTLALPSGHDQARGGPA